MNIRRRCFIALAVAGALTTGTASATTPLMTDPSGDATVAPCWLTDQVDPSQCATMNAHLPSQPSIDVVSADITSGATSLDFTISVVDLGTATAVERAGFVVQSTGGHGVSIVASRGPSGSPVATVWGGPTEGSYVMSVPITYDDTTDTITTTVTLATLSDATGTTVQSGSVLGGLSVWTSQDTTTAVGSTNVGGPSDAASTGSTYTV